jgi:hypothetical protein
MFHYNLTLQLFIVDSAETMLEPIRHVLEPKLLGELLRILVDGCPAKFNAYGTHRQFREMLAFLGKTMTRLG